MEVPGPSAHMQARTDTTAGPCISSQPCSKHSSSCSSKLFGLKQNDPLGLYLPTRNPAHMASRSLTLPQWTAPIARGFGRRWRLAGGAASRLLTGSIPAARGRCTRASCAPRRPPRRSGRSAACSAAARRPSLQRIERTGASAKCAPTFCLRHTRQQGPPHVDAAAPLPSPHRPVTLNKPVGAASMVPSQPHMTYCSPWNRKAQPALPTPPSAPTAPSTRWSKGAGIPRQKSPIVVVSHEEPWVGTRNREGPGGVAV